MNAPTDPESTLAQANTIADSLRAWRRYLHANPELSGSEHATAAFVAHQLRQLGLTPHEGIVGTCGLTATINVNDTPAVALRADMDALPVDEKTSLPFASSKPGVMHACGHDAHVAMLLGAATLLYQRRAQLKRSVRFIFQPSEEKHPGGAAPMIAGGVLDDVESVFGLHVWSLLPVGSLGTRSGAFMAGVTDLRIEIRGRGGHAAMPEQSIDPIVVAAEVVLALQTIVSRSIALTDSAVVSVTMMHAGTANNVIPEVALLQGTIRTLNEGVRARVCHRVTELVQGLAGAHGASATVELLPVYPLLVNDAATVDRVLKAAGRVGFTADRLHTLDPIGGGEDFAYYAQKVPSAFAFLGGGRPGCTNYPHHHPRFDIDEAALPLGAALLAQYALDSPPT